MGRRWDNGGKGIGNNREDHLTNEELARNNDDKEFSAARRELLRSLPDATLLNRFEQTVINRTMRATLQIKDTEGVSV